MRDAGDIAAGPASPPRVACVMMQRDETLCLRPWLAYHSRLFGLRNLFVLDHGSTDRQVLAVLAAHQARGLNVERLPEGTDFRDKGALVSAALARADASHDYDFLFPLDCDEFVTMRDASGQPTCAPASLLGYLETLADQSAPLLVSENFLNVLGHPDRFFALPYRKVFFTGGNSGAVDDGSHECVSRTEPPLPTRIVYTHFHHKPFEVQRAMSRQKLRPYVDPDDPVALAAYRGTGWHLTSHLLKTKEEYMRIMALDGRAIQFPAIGAMLAQLGVAPNFVER